MVDITGWNRYKRKTWYYLDIKSARRPVPHCSEVPITVFSSPPDFASDDTVFETMKERDGHSIIFSDSISASRERNLLLKANLIT